MTMFEPTGDNHVDAFNNALEEIFAQRKSAGSPGEADEPTGDDAAATSGAPPEGTGSDISPTSTVDDGDKESGSGEGGTEGPTPDPGVSNIPEPLYNPPPAATAPDQGTGEQVYEIGGRTLTQTELNNVLALSDYWSQVPTEQVQNVDAYLRGQAQIQAPSPTPTPTATPTATSPDVNADEWEDPRAAAAFHQMQEELATLRAQTQALTQHTVQTGATNQQRQMENSIDQALQVYGEKRQLSAEELSAMTDAVESFNIFGGIVAKNGGDIPKAVDEAFDLIYWQVPALRDRAFQQVLAKQVEEDAGVRHQRRRATSLSTGGSSAPRTRPTAPQSGDAFTSMVAELNAAMNGGQEQ